MRDLVKIYEEDVIETGTFLLFGTLEQICKYKLEQQIERKDFSILNITRVQNIEKDCLDCYVDYEFWEGGGK